MYMPPKRKPVKRKSLKNPVTRATKQKQSQSQKVVVNVNTIKSKPRKKSGRGGLPPPSYQHNLAPTFVTAQATDYTPIIGAIASLTSRLQPKGDALINPARGVGTPEEPRIQQPVTPLSSATSFTTQQAQSMAGQKAEERREGPTAGNFQPLPSLADERVEMPPDAPITSKITFTPKEKRKKQGFKPILKLGGERKDEKLVIKPNESQQTLGGRLSQPGDPYYRETLSTNKGYASGGGGSDFVEAVATPKKGRPRKDTQKAIPVNPPQQAQAEAPKKRPKKKKLPAGQSTIDKMFNPEI